MLVGEPVRRERKGRTSRLNCGFVRERGTVLTSMTTCASAALSSATNSSVGRVECPMVKKGLGIEADRTPLSRAALARVLMGCAAPDCPRALNRTG